MSRFTRLFMVLVSASMLFLAFTSETSLADSSPFAQVTPAVGVSPQAAAKVVCSSKTTLQLYGACIYVNHMRGHTATYQKSYYKKLSATARKAVSTYISKYGKQTASSGTSSSCNPRIRVCPLILEDQVTGSTMRQLSVNANGIGGCWSWTLTVSEGSYTFVYPWPLPIWTTWFTFQLYNSFCSDGQKITSFYAEPSTVSTMPLFWNYNGNTTSVSSPELGAEHTDYFVQANYEMSPPLVSKIVVIVHQDPWIRIHVHANGTGTVEEGISS